MIQRIQSVYLLLSAICAIVCACLPIATIEPSGMGVDTVMYNLAVYNQSTPGADYTVCGLFVLLIVVAATSVINIFRYNTRMRQSRHCLVTMMLLLAWVGLFAVLSNKYAGEGDTLHVAFASCLPLIALIFQWLARRGILHDEKLVKAADRIR